MDCKWKIIGNGHPHKTWICDSLGNRITPMMGAASAYKIVKEHNKTIEYLNNIKGTTNSAEKEGV